MTTHTISDNRTDAVISFSVDWGMPGSRSYPAEAPTAHSIEITMGGELIGPTDAHEILSRWTDADLIREAAEQEQERADDEADHKLNLRREAAE